MPEIIAEILYSDKWHSIVKDDSLGMKRVLIKESCHDSEPCVFIEIWAHEIHIKIARSNYNYRVFYKDNCLTCEYIGPHTGLFNQKSIPTLTPVISIQYILSGLDRENENEDEDGNGKTGHSANKDYVDEFIHDDIPIPVICP